VYKLKPSLRFLRAGYALKHLKNSDEFLLTDGVLPEGSHFSPNRRLARIVTAQGVLSVDKKTLTPWARKVAESVYQAFCLRKVRFAKLIKIFRPGFLAKG
jgi:hypothetical protein